LLDKGRTNEIYNVCSGSVVRLSDILRKFEAISGIAVEIDIDQERLRSNEISQIFGDAGKIRTETGWTPQIPLETTLRDLLNYWRESIKGGSSASAH
jgi:GDP-4-dehydro-6-deoxy-D-mannose reductase